MNNQAEGTSIISKQDWVSPTIEELGSVQAITREGPKDGTDRTHVGMKGS